jgi:hypothetical protein
VPIVVLFLSVVQGNNPASVANSSEEISCVNALAVCSDLHYAKIASQFSGTFTSSTSRHLPRRDLLDEEDHLGKGPLGVVHENLDLRDGLGSKLAFVLCKEIPRTEAVRRP